MTAKFQYYFLLCCFVKIDQNIAAKYNIIIGLIKSKAVVHEIDPFELKFFSKLRTNANQSRVRLAAQKISALQFKRHRVDLFYIVYTLVGSLNDTG